MLLLQVNEYTGWMNKEKRLNFNSEDKSCVVQAYVVRCSSTKMEINIIEITYL